MTETTAPPRYNVLGELRDGPARRTYRARDGETQAEIALHTWPRDGVPRAVLLALQSSIAPYTTLDHPRLLRTRSLRADAENVVLECAHVAGESLERALVRETRMLPARALAIAEDVFDGLVVLHAAGLAHGAVRPSTVWLGRDGRAHLVAAGVSPILVPMLAADDFFSVFERLVPSSPDRRAARDVYAACALLYAMIEGHAPLAADSPNELAARIRRERWSDPIGESVASVLSGASPWRDDGSIPDAATLLALVRRSREQADRAAVAPKHEPSLLDDVSTPALLQPTIRERARERLRRAARRVFEFVTGSAWPTFAAAGIAALLATLLAPFLGRDGGWTGAQRSAQAMPPGNALTAVTAPAPAAPPSTAPRRDPPPARSAWDRTREEAQALTEIGDFQAALALLSTADGPGDQLLEERHAVIARAGTRLRELREITQKLADTGSIADAQKPWDDALVFWPNEQLRTQALEERRMLEGIAESAALRRTSIASDKTQRQMDDEVASVVIACFARDEGKHDARLKLAGELLQKAIAANYTAARDDADAIRAILEAESALAAAAGETLKKRTRRVTIESVSKRFGTGTIVDANEDALVVLRAGDKREEIPVTRLSGRERHAFFATFRVQGNGAHTIALAALALRGGLVDEAKTELWEAEAVRGVDRAVRLLRRALEETQKK
jgi:hypothetical protein